MNYVDPILKYLADELSPEERKSFQEHLTSNEKFKGEFVEISLAYELIRDQLVERDELAFKQKLKLAMDRELPPAKSPRSPQLRWWFSLVAIAATLAMVLMVLSFPPSEKRLMARFYAPEQDPALMTLLQDTRGAQNEGILYYKNHRYQDAMKVLEPLLSRSPDQKPVLLCYLLSAMELDREREVIDQLLNREISYSHLPDQALSWYATLALIKSKHPQEAMSMLEPLTKVAGPYRVEAENLLKLLLK